MLILAPLTFVSHNSRRHSSLTSVLMSIITMPVGSIEVLTGEQATELILTLAGRLAAAMEVPAEERAKAEEKTMDTLVSVATNHMTMR